MGLRRRCDAELTLFLSLRECPPPGRIRRMGYAGRQQPIWRCAIAETWTLASESRPVAMQESRAGARVSREDDGIW
jgi:hypothetical protein